MRMEIVDGYCHCGLSKYRPVGDVRRFMKRMDISRTVLVQHLGEYDNSYIEQIVSAEPERFVGVFLVDVGAEHAQEFLAFWAQQKEFRGIRLLAHTLETHPKLWEQVAQSDLFLGLFHALYRLTRGAHVLQHRQRHLLGRREGLYGHVGGEYLGLVGVDPAGEVALAGDVSRRSCHSYSSAIGATSGPSPRRQPHPQPGPPGTRPVADRASRRLRPPTPHPAAGEILPLSPRPSANPSTCLRCTRQARREGGNFGNQPSNFRHLWSCWSRPMIDT